MTSRTMKRVASILIVVGMLNFASFMIVALILGGDTVNGKSDGQRYYLGSHGRYTEVLRPTFEYSRLHTHSVWITHPLIFVGGGILAWLKKKERAAHAA